MDNLDASRNRYRRHCLNVLEVYIRYEASPHSMVRTVMLEIIDELRAETDPPARDEGGEMTKAEVKALKIALVQHEESRPNPDVMPQDDPYFIGEQKYLATFGTNGASVHTEEREEYASCDTAGIMGSTLPDGEDDVVCPAEGEPLPVIYIRPTFRKPKR